MVQKVSVDRCLKPPSADRIETSVMDGIVHTMTVKTITIRFAVPLVEEGQCDGEEAVVCYEESVQPPHAEEVERYVTEGRATVIAERPFACDAAGEDLRVRNCSEDEINGNRAHACQRTRSGSEAGGTARRPRLPACCRSR